MNRALPSDIHGTGIIGSGIIGSGIGGSGMNNEQSEAVWKATHARLQAEFNSVKESLEAEKVHRQDTELQQQQQHSQQQVHQSNIEKKLNHLHKKWMKLKIETSEGYIDHCLLSIVVVAVVVVISVFVVVAVVVIVVVVVFINVFWFNYVLQYS